MNIFWTAPDVAVQANSTFDRVHVYRSGSEQSNYTQIDDVESKNGLAVSYNDLTGTPSFYYYVRYFDSLNNVQTNLITAFAEFTPREVRLITQLKTSVPPVMMQTTTDQDLRMAIFYAIGMFNIYPPSTNFDITSFPIAYEQILLTMSQYTLLAYKYLGVATRDFSYTDNGLSLNLDRGGKIKLLMDQQLAYFSKLLEVVKLDFGFLGTGVGTTSLPLSIGGNISPASLNILNIFNSLS